MTILVLVEHNNHRLHANIRNILTAAYALNQPITCLVVGYNCAELAMEVASLSGLKSVFLIDEPDCAHPSAELYAELVVRHGKSFQYILGPASTFGKNCLPGIAARLDVTQVSEVTKIIDHETFEHPIYAGNAIETVRILDPVKVLSIRSTNFDAVTAQQPPCPIEKLALHKPAVQAEFLNESHNQAARPDLGDARIIVSGGRGLQNAEKFRLVEQLADVLGGAVGASRAAVDAGFVPNEYQIGQTGRVVAPTLYIAIGISGAIQHIAGMKDSKIIVAINRDADAPIFQIANYGLVGDLFELVPELIEKIQAGSRNF